uniref:Calmodulin-like protein 1 n=2 Tax=Nicotiana TaxID=4085 RepID=A0A1S3ZL23_TOBAC|nr:PREDICTED: calmodulin-like protein 1 [Nicotiana tabacum]
MSLPNFRPKEEEMKRVFDKFDTNKDGKISKEEYKSAMKMMRAADTDGDGFINFEEFMRVQNLEGGVNPTDIKSAFKAFDLDGDGKISADELLQVQRMLGEKCSLENCKKMVRGVDANGDGLIDMDEFVTMMTRTMKLV